eukprot:m.26683 g.26683  ORF g.26683 m.26683 type:complete len:297 (-) comp11699_c1_seq2:579-1469(-)
MAQSKEQLPSLTICSFNIHGFCNPSGNENVTELICFLLHARPHILCLQEFDRSAQPITTVTASSPQALQPLLDKVNAHFKHRKVLILPWLGAFLSVLHDVPITDDNHLAWASLATITAFPITPRPDNTSLRPKHRDSSVAKGGRSDRILAVQGEGVAVINIHLDHVASATRHKQLKHYLARQMSQQDAQVWVGDWNALTRADYTAKQWADIATVRARNSWEPPQTIVMEQAAKAGLVDAMVLARGKPLPTSRFATRIDYVLLNSAARESWVVESCHTQVDMSMSDHKPVLVQLVRR